MNGQNWLLAFGTIHIWERFPFHISDIKRLTFIRVISPNDENVIFIIYHRMIPMRRLMWPRA